MWSGEDLAFSLKCPAILVLEFWSVVNESLIALPWAGWEQQGGGEGGHLPPVSHAKVQTRLELTQLLVWTNNLAAFAPGPGRQSLSPGISQDTESPCHWRLPEPHS